MSNKLLAILLTLLPIQSKQLDSKLLNSKLAQSKQLDSNLLQSNLVDSDESEYQDDRTTVSDGTVYPYMAAVMMKGMYVSCGALIDHSWVLTSAEGAESMRQSLKLLRIRLGSINYKKGGLLFPAKLIEIHPNYNRTKPGFDLALIMLAHPARFTPSLRSISLQLTPKEVDTTHFIVTSWPGPLERKLNNSTKVTSIDEIRRHRILTVSHLHPEDAEECADELNGAVGDDAVVCLEATLTTPCLREYGAPVIVNNVLWAVISSWKTENCEDNISYSQSVLGTLVSEENVSSWIHDTVHREFNLRP